MNKLIWPALMVSFLLISGCDQSSDDATDADKSVMENAVEMTEEMPAEVTDSASEAMESMENAAEETMDSASEMMDEHSSDMDMPAEEDMPSEEDMDAMHDTMPNAQ